MDIREDNGAENQTDHLVQEDASYAEIRESAVEFTKAERNDRNEPKQGRS